MTSVLWHPVFRVGVSRCSVHQYRLFVTSAQVWPRCQETRHHDPGVHITVKRFQVWKLHADPNIRLYSALFGSTSITQVWPQEEEEAQFLVQESGPCVCGYPCVDDQCEGGECGRRRVSSEDQLTMKPHQNKLLQNLFQELTLTWIHFPVLNY